MAVAHMVGRPAPVNPIKQFTKAVSAAFSAAVRTIQRVYRGSRVPTTRRYVMRRSDGSVIRGAQARTAIFKDGPTELNWFFGPTPSGLSNRMDPTNTFQLATYELGPDAATDRFLNNKWLKWYISRGFITQEQALVSSRGRGPLFDITKAPMDVFGDRNKLREYRERMKNRGTLGLFG
eukprot:488864-Prymnesium_polylepis.2